MFVDLTEGRKERGRVISVLLVHRRRRAWWVAENQLFCDQSEI